MNYQNNSNSIGVKICVKCYYYISIHATYKYICKINIFFYSLQYFLGFLFTNENHTYH